MDPKSLHVGGFEPCWQGCAADSKRSLRLQEEYHHLCCCRRLSWKGKYSCARESINAYFHTPLRSAAVADDNT